MSVTYYRFTVRAGATATCLTDSRQLLDGDGTADTEHYGYKRGQFYYYHAGGETYRVNSRDVIKAEAD